MRQVRFKQNKPFGLFLPAGFGGKGYEPVAQTNLKGRLYDGASYGVADSLASSMYVEDGEWTLILGLQQNDPGGAERIFTLGDTNGTNLPAWQIRTATTTADCQLLIFNASVTVFTATIAAGLFDGARHFLVITETVSGGTATVKVSVDGAALASKGTYTRFTWTPDYATIGALRYDAGPTVLNPYTGVYSDVAWLSRALVDADIAQLYSDWNAGTLDLQQDSGAYTADLDNFVLNTWQGEATDAAGSDVNQTKGGGSITYTGTTIVDWPYTWPNTKSVRYNGVDENSIYTGGAALTLPYTVMGWIRFPAGGLTLDRPIDVGVYNDDSVRLYRNSSTQLTAQVKGSDALSQIAGSWADDGAFRHFAIVATSAGGCTWEFFIGGVSQGTATHSNDGSPASCGVALGCSLIGTLESQVDIYKFAIEYSDLSGSLATIAADHTDDWSGYDHYYACGQGSDSDSTLYDTGVGTTWNLTNTGITAAANFITAEPS